LRLVLRANPDRFPLGFVFGLAGLITLPAFYFLQPRFPRLLSGCRFREWSGRPCPTCGGSRAIHDLMHGRIGEAFLHNPLVVAGLALLAGWFLLSLAAEVVGRREIEVILSRREKIAARVLAVALPLINWGYLIWSQG
jgi:hypothetical protein